MNLSFAHPAFFWLLFALPALVLLKVLMDARGRVLLQRAVAARLAPTLVRKPRAWRSWTALTLELLAIAALITTLARPQLGFVEEEILTSGRSIMIALDTSRSMLATDMQPDRITRTKMTISDLINKLKADRIGLIAFAGKPFVQAPITQDHEALLETLDQCDTEIIPRGGSNMAEAIDLAMATFAGRNLPPGKTFESLSSEEKALIEKSQATSQAMLIFSDGEELEGKAVAAAKRAADANITIITVGVGTKAGGIMPNPDNGGRDYIRDTQGKIVKTVLQQEVLEEIAKETKGLYLPLSEVVTDKRLELILSKLDASTNKNKTLKKAVERYQWPLIAGMVFLLAAIAVRIIPRFKPMNVAAPAMKYATLLLGLLAVASSVSTTLAQTKTIPLNMEALATPKGSQPAEKAEPKSVPINVRPYEEKLAAISNTTTGGNDHIAWTRLGEGSVAYARGDFDGAVDGFGKALLGNDASLRTQAYFNLANTLFQRAQASVTGVKKLDPDILGDLISRLKESVTNYGEALVLKPDHKEAADNKKKVEDFIKTLEAAKKQMEEQKGKKKGKKGEKGDKSKGEGDEEGEEDGEGEGQDGKPGKSKKGKKKDQAGKDQEDGEGEEGEEQEGGEGGDKPKDKDGKEGGGEEDKRSEEQKAQEQAAQEASNKDMKGKVEAMNQGKGQGDKGKDKGKEGEKGEAEESKDGIPNEKTGFSRTEARRNIQRLSDDVQVRPRIEQAPPDRPFKNW